MNNAEKVGQIIKEKRIEKGLTQKELANILFVESTTVSRWECGLGYPNVQTLSELCEILELDISNLLYEQTKSEQKGNNVTNKPINLRTPNIVLNIVLILLSTFALIMLFLMESKTTMYFFSDAHDVSSDRIQFIITVVLVLTLLVCILINLIHLSLKREPLIPTYFYLIDTIGLSVVSFISFLSNSNILYFGLLSSLMQALCLISIGDFLLNSKLETKFLKILYSVIFGFLSFICFCLLYISLASTTLVTSSIIYKIVLYFPVVMSNTLACYIVTKLASKNTKISILITSSLFIVLNILFMLQFTGSSEFTIFLKVLALLGLVGSPMILLYPTLNLFNK